MLGVVLNEKKVLSDALDGKFDKNKMTTLYVLMKYYYNKEIDYHTMKEKLIYYMQSHFKEFKRKVWESSISRMVRKFYDTIKRLDDDGIASYLEIVETKEIKFSEQELNHIRKLNDIKLERLFFIILCYCKVQNNHNWIHQPLTNLFKEAKISDSNNNKMNMLNKLFELNYIEIPKSVNNTNIKITIPQFEDDNFLVINSFDNIIYKYISFRDSKINCNICDKPVKKSVNKKYCNECWEKHRNEYQKELMKNRRKT